MEPDNRTPGKHQTFYNIYGNAFNIGASDEKVGDGLLLQAQRAGGQVPLNMDNVQVMLARFLVL